MRSGTSEIQIEDTMPPFSYASWEDPSIESDPSIPA